MLLFSFLFDIYYSIIYCIITVETIRHTLHRLIHPRRKQTKLHQEKSACWCWWWTLERYKKGPKKNGVLKLVYIPMAFSLKIMATKWSQTATRTNDDDNKSNVRDGANNITLKTLHLLFSHFRLFLYLFCQLCYNILIIQWSKLESKKKRTALSKHHQQFHKLNLSHMSPHKKTDRRKKNQTKENKTHFPWFIYCKDKLTSTWKWEHFFCLRFKKGLEFHRPTQVAKKYRFKFYFFFGSF